MENYIVVNIDSTRDPEKWFQRQRNYEVVFLSYENGPQKGRFLQRLQSLTPLVEDMSIPNAGKWRNIDFFLRTAFPYPREGENYFWFPDPDIECLFEITELFRFARNHGFKICQPSLTGDSICSHPVLKHREHSLYRPDFVEVMMPLFSQDAVRRAAWTFPLTYSGYGIDLLWKLELPTVVIDYFQARHAERPHFDLTAQRRGWPDPVLEMNIVKRAIEVVRGAWREPFDEQAISVIRGLVEKQFGTVPGTNAELARRSRLLSLLRDNSYGGDEQEMRRK